jgi:two-component system cell cycle response regulator DivK
MKYKPRPRLWVKVMLKVLYIEDDPQQVEIIRMFLARENVEVVNARDGVSGWQAVQQEQPALVLIDINLPAMTGLEVAELIRANPDLCHIPLIALTSTLKISHQTADISRLFDAYLSKPIMRADVVNCVRSLIGQANP